MNTDIFFGNNFGMHTACVLTGVTSADDLKNLDDSVPKLRPELVFPGVASLLTSLKQAHLLN
ncbi:unnamed protein product [Protopolystoma xenopodis]|uniref:Uncharacterized protein n=1 Tax=Protopolystoma xenopodis TaxID=117903 RepID=A0A448WGF5_9PLAT|nr:unnamed protein product [Protopolystoma xenopodis]